MMDEILAGLNFICETLVVPLSLSSGDRLLEVEGPAHPVRFLKLQLQERDYLHLARLMIYARTDKGVVDVAPASHLATSSAWGDTGWMVEKRSVLTGEDDGWPYAVHTEVEDHPWILVTLPRSMPIERVVIRNRSDHLTYRALSLTVQASTDNDRWMTLHDNGLLLAGLRRTLAHSISRHVLDPATTEALAFGLELMWLWHLGATHQLNQLWDTHCIGNNRTPAHTRVVDYINRRLLFEHQRELTLHGISRSFRFWDKVEKQAYVAFADRVTAALRQLSNKVCLGYGTVLGIVRDQDLLPHDDDIDVLVAMPLNEVGSLSNVIRAVETVLRPHGLNVDGDFPSHRWVHSPDGHRLDVFVGLVEGEHVSFFPGRRRQIAVDDIYPGRTAQLHGTQVVLPANPERYLSLVYGEDWNVPSNTFRHSWDISEFHDVL